MCSLGVWYAHLICVAVFQVLLAEVCRLLLVRAKERFSRRILSWPYGGVTAEVRGLQPEASGSALTCMVL